jgi:hypothetical protein
MRARRARLEVERDEDVKPVSILLVSPVSPDLTSRKSGLLEKVD